MLTNSLHKKVESLQKIIGKRTWYVLIAIAMIQVIIASCYKETRAFFNKDLSEANIIPEYSVPLGNFSFNINNNLNELRMIPFNFPDSLIFNNDTLPCPTEIDTTQLIPFSFTSISEEFNNITLLMLRFIFSNGYPTDIEVEASLCAQDSNEIHYFDNYIIEGAEIDQNNKVTGYHVSEPHDIIVPENIIAILNQVSFIKFYYRIQTRINSDNLSWFFEDYDIKLHVGARIQYEVSVKPQ